MIKKNQSFFNLLNRISDVVVIYLCYIASLYLWLKVEDNISKSILEDKLVIIAYLFLMLILFQIFKLYDSYRFKTVISEIAQIVKAVSVSILLLALVLYFFKLQEFSRGVLGVYYVSLIITISAKRVTLRKILRHYRKLGYNQKHVVIVGNGNLAKRYAQSIQENPQYGFIITGYVSKTEHDGLGKRLGMYEDLEEILKNPGIDEVVVALEPHEVQFISQVISACEKQGTKVFIIPFYNDYIPTTPSIDVINDIKLINMRTTPLDNDFCAFQKRLMDIVCSLILIIITSPIMLVAVIGTKLSSPGPVIFKQERVGRNKKIFTMYKFRSMRINDKSTTAWSTGTDPRKTVFGSFIRKTSIDELPQFFNVLKGDMSLVGPRPEIPFYVEQFKEEIPLYMVKHQVRPGITGWAQVNGFRGDTSIEGRIKHDIWYIENWSIFLDIKIVFMTAFGGMINKEKIQTKKENVNV